MTQLPEYPDIAACLRDGAGGATAAESHGTLCGLLCAAAGDLPEAWIENTLADSHESSATPSAADHHLLGDLYKSTLAALQGTQMSFRPLLPDDSEDLTARIDALASWSQGFLYGLAVRGLKDFGDLDGEVREFLEDLVQITRAEPDENSDAETNEAAYAEVVEYLRVGVQLVYEQGASEIDIPGATGG